jgi:hypothetical protein
LNLESVCNVPESLELDGYFVAMLVWDADNASVTEITELARKLIDAGCAYLCCWGADCERVHDVFDTEYVRSNVDDSSNTIMTTWHDGDTLEEFIYWTLRHTTPTEKYHKDCRTVFAIVIDSVAAESEIQTAFADPKGFCRVQEDRDS